MINEAARVVAVDEEYVLLELNNRTTCDNCSTETHCGNNILRQLFTKKSNQIKIPLQFFPAKVNPGDAVEFAMQDSALIYSVLLAYLFPLFCMLSAIIVLSFFINIHEVLIFFGGIFALFFGIFLAKKIATHKNASQFQLKIISVNGVKFFKELN